ncbi:MAG: DUF5117 domain-containing protein [Planctomycetota bacterium]|nr:MAG: DUF5117 domain-containing protein [Planctomycetota bacterium]
MKSKKQPALPCAFFLLSSFFACVDLARAADAAAQGPPPASEFLKGYEASRGIYTVHRKGHKLYLEVPSSQMKRPFLLATAIAGGPTFAGFQWGERVCAWERVDERLVLFEREVRYRTKNPRKPMAPIVERTYTDRVLYTAPVLALAGGNPVIDLNALLGGQAKTFFGAVAEGLDAGLVMVRRLKCFPKNMVVEVTLPDGNRDGRLTTLSYSFSSLPHPRSDRYRPRKADDRVGTFLTVVKDFSDETAEGDRFVRFVNRWNVEKADGSLARSPVKKPIVFYVEKTVPYRFRHAVTQGILEWNKAFERLGLLGAIQVRQQTDTEFADLDPEDVRYNFFRWIVSERAFAMGPSRVNPYSGQILDADIVFDESMVRSYLRQYDVRIKKAPRKFFSPEVQRLLDEDPRRFPFAHAEGPDEEALRFGAPDAWACELGEGVMHQVQLGLLASRLRGGRGDFPQEFIDQVVKDVVMHEVGHTLGLRHNFKASAWRSLAEINSDEAPGDPCASVMDYNPINVVPEGQRQGAFTMHTLGPYDYWAIRYAYDPDESKAREATIAAVGSRQFAYGTDEDTRGPDPYCTRWDLGSDPLEYAEQRMTLDRQLWPKVVERAVGKGEPYRDARRALTMLLYDYQNAALIAGRFVGGQKVSRLHKGDPGDPLPLEPVPAEVQRRALKLVCERVLARGNFDLPPRLLRALGSENWRHWGTRPEPHAFPYHQTVLDLQSWALFSLINPATLSRLLDSEAKVEPHDDLVTVPEVFLRVSEAIFGDLLDRPASLSGEGTAREPLVPTVQRNLQRRYVSWLISMTIEPEDGPTPAAVRTLARLEARAIAERLEGVLARERDHPSELVLDPYTRGHLEDTIGRLRKALDASFTIGD